MSQHGRKWEGLWFGNYEKIEIKKYLKTKKMKIIDNDGLIFFTVIVTIFVTIIIVIIIIRIIIIIIIIIIFLVSTTIGFGLFL